MKICFLDTETTSLKKGRLVQLAYEVYDSNKPENGLIVERKYKPPVPIEFEAMAVHHITEKMVEEKYAFLPADMGNILENYIFTAHNASFDLGVMEREGVPIPKYWICTKKVAQYYLDYPAYNLQYLRYRFGLELEATAHDALGDITVLKSVFMRLFTIALEEESGSTTKTEREIIKKMVSISKNPVKIKRFVFGKFK